MVNMFYVDVLIRHVEFLPLRLFVCPLQDPNSKTKDTAKHSCRRLPGPDNKCSNF